MIETTLTRGGATAPPPPATQPCQDCGGIMTAVDPGGPFVCARCGVWAPVTPAPNDVRPGWARISRKSGVGIETPATPRDTGSHHHRAPGAWMPRPAIVPSRSTLPTLDDYDRR